MNELRNLDSSLCYTMDTLGEAIPLGRSLLGQLVHSEGFPAIKVGNRIIVPKKALERWLQEKSLEMNRPA